MTKHHNSIFVIILFLFIQGQAQNSAYFKSIIHSKKISKIRKETILDSLFSNLNQTNFHDFHEYSKWLKSNKKLDKAIRINKLALNKKNICFEENSEIRKKIIKNIGYFNFLKKEYFQSLYYYHQTTLINEKPIYTEVAFRKMGQIFFRLGDYYNAEKYFDKALFISNKKDINLYLFSCENASVNLKKLKTKQKFNKALDILNGAARIIENDKLFKFNKNLSIYKHIGNLYTENIHLDTLQNFKNGVENYNKSLKIALKRNDSTRISEVLNNIGYLHLIANKSNALTYFNQSINYTKSKLHKSRIYSNISSYFQQKQKFELSLLNINKSINILTGNDQNNTTKTLENSALNTNTHKFYLLNKYITKGILLNKLNRHNEALETFKTSDYLLDLVRYESNNSASKLFWQEKASLLFMEATKACFNLNKPESVLYFIEKNKAILLLENIANKKNTSKEEIDFEIYKDLKMSDYKTKDFSNEEKIVTLKQVQDNLKPDTVVLDYIITDTIGYVLNIEKNDITLHQIENINNLNKNIKTYLDLISKPISKKADLIKLKVSSKNISKTLFPSGMEIKNECKLIIIPDYNIQNIPFESLYYNNQIVIKTHETSYAYSYSFLLMNNLIKRNPKKQLISFAPYAFNYDNLKPLNNSVYESEEITKTLNGDNFQKELATTDNFKKQIFDYNIINISSHANAQDSITPWIAF